MTLTPLQTTHPSPSERNSEMHQSFLSVPTGQDCPIGSILTGVGNTKAFNFISFSNYEPRKSTRNPIRPNSRSLQRPRTMDLAHRNHLHRSERPFDFIRWGMLIPHSPNSPCLYSKSVTRTGSSPHQTNRKLLSEQSEIYAKTPRTSFRWKNTKRNKRHYGDCCCLGSKPKHHPNPEPSRSGSLKFLEILR